MYQELAGSEMATAALWSVTLACGQKFSPVSLKWHTIHDKCELPVHGGNPLDAQILGCSLMVERTKKWVDMCELIRVLPCMEHIWRSALHAS